MILPAKNEEASIRAVLEDVFQHLPQAQVILIDAGHDKTSEMARDFGQGPQLQIELQEHASGKGYAIQMGIDFSRREFIAQLDTDGQFSAACLKKMLEALIESKVDFVCGSRFMAENSFRLRLRDFGNFFFSSYASLLSGHRFTDILSGIKCWRAEITKAFRLRQHDFCYEVELPLRAKKRGFSVIDVPVVTAERESGESKVNIWQVGWRLLWVIPSILVFKR